MGLGNPEQDLVLAAVLWKCILKDMELELALENGGGLSKLGLSISGGTNNDLSHEGKIVQFFFSDGHFISKRREV